MEAVKRKMNLREIFPPLLGGKTFVSYAFYLALEKLCVKCASLEVTRCILKELIASGDAAAAVGRRSLIKQPRAAVE
jgi:hypothetical protein